MNFKTSPRNLARNQNQKN